MERLRTTTFPSAKNTWPAATCADGGRIAPMHPRAGTGIGANVVLALATPSRPAIATVLYVHALAVPFASRTANKSGREGSAVGVDNVALGWAAPHAARRRKRIAAPVVLIPAATVIRRIGFSLRREA